jgi:hypothetical protein
MKTLISKSITEDSIEYKLQTQITRVWPPQVDLSFSWELYVDFHKQNK